MSKNGLNYTMVKSTPNLSGWKQAKFLCLSCYKAIRGGQGVSIQFRLEHCQSQKFPFSEEKECPRPHTPRECHFLEKTQKHFLITFAQTRHMVPPKHERPRKCNQPYVVPGRGEVANELFANIIGDCHKNTFITQYLLETCSCYKDLLFFWRGVLLFWKGGYLPLSFLRHTFLSGFCLALSCFSNF